MGKKRIFVDLDSQVHKTIVELKNKVLEDDKLVFFTMHTHSEQAWLRYIISMGLVKLKQDFDRWKKGVEDNEVRDKDREETR